MKKIALDKRKHFLVGIPLGILLQIISLYFFSAHLLASVAVSFATLCVGCYAFELYSLITGKGHYELADVWFGVAGGAVGIAAVLMLRLL